MFGYIPRFLLVITLGTAVAAMAREGFQNSAGNSSQVGDSSSPPRPTEEEFLTIKDGRLNLRVRNRTMDWLLEILSEKSGVVIIPAGGFEAQRLSIELRDVPLEQGLRQILIDQDSFFLYAADSDAPASLKLIWVYPKGGSRGVRPVAKELWASTKELEGGLDDADPEVRSRALVALIERKSAGARNAAIRALSVDKDSRVRARVLQAAMSRELDIPADLVMKMLLDSSETVRFLALDYLGEHPQASVIAQQALNDASEHVRNKAREILQRVEHAAAPPASPQPSVQGQQPRQRPQFP